MRALKLVFSKYKLHTINYHHKKSLFSINIFQVILWNVYECINGLGPSYGHDLFHQREHTYNIHGTV